MVNSHRWKYSTAKVPATVWFVACVVPKLAVGKGVCKPKSVWEKQFVVRGTGQYREAVANPNGRKKRKFCEGWEETLLGQKTWGSTGLMQFLPKSE